ncbi:pyridoxamine 5'-phosphate oxidase family protein [Arthrobacter sp. MSA 4-2]|uniref:pyridoxamine 5'-phosphate oxidase family protein n=1 Tax=Arthrobacter sp. MSA 4-2 TaxID=2794349 RepID=UPI0018E73E13|nr:pyridoxamine 5'-phosphate oxidase family protein [Arthrobacter sp. MSA 4-2]MBJ2120859.1 pyridoxamine 5'-phosphate oxidase family protein [Arthrobacter sp. MSA 4-2]
MDTQQEGMQELRKILDKADIAILTTTNAQGQLVSRPLAVHGKDFDGDLWFFTEDPSPKADEIRANPQVNVSVSTGKGYLSIAGTASLTRDQAKIDELWGPTVSAWFENGRDDPAVALIKVDADTAEYWSMDAPRVVSAVKMVKGLVTGSKPDTGKNEVIDL